MKALFLCIEALYGMKTKLITKKTIPNSKFTFDSKFHREDTIDNSIYKLLALMKSVNINSSEARLNVTSIGDNDGGRILL